MRVLRLCLRAGDALRPRPPFLAAPVAFPSAALRAKVVVSATARAGLGPHSRAENSPDWSTNERVVALQRLLEQLAATRSGDGGLCFRFCLVLDQCVAL